MLKIRYIMATGELTGWNGDLTQHQNLKVRAGQGEAVKVLDIPIPNKPLDALLYDGQALIPNPSYIKQ